MTASAPALTGLALEPLRGGISMLQGIATMVAAPFEKKCRGRGQPVMVLPGLGTNEHATFVMRRFLIGLGYRARDWGQGINTGPRGNLDMFLQLHLQEQLQAVYHVCKRQKVVLLGWSLGGIFARELAKLRPDLVELVISMGTPLTGDPDATNAKFLYELFNGPSELADRLLLERIKQPPPVPCISIYSRSDGVVAWQSCVTDPQGSTRGIEVEGVSHLGLMSHPAALRAVAGVLSAHFSSRSERS